MRPRLRLFTGDENATSLVDPPMTVRLGDISEILADALNSRRTWVEDFADDEVQVSADLYEVLSTYWRLRPSA